MKMLELIHSWEKLADKYVDRARAATNSYTTERLLAASETFLLCADQLRRELAKQKERDAKNG